MNLKNLIKPVLYILGGAALGGGISYFLAHREIKRVEEEFDVFTEKISSELAKSFVKKHVETSSDPKVSEPERDEDGHISVNASIRKPAILELMEKVSNSAQLPVETMFSPITVIEDEPFLVAENAIDFNDDKYNSEVGYTYYQDGILIDENDEIIADPDDILPSGWRDCFGWNCRSDDKFFAVNPKLHLLIEVVRSNISYAQWIEDDYGVEE